MDANTREELAIHIKNAADKQLERADYYRDRAKASTVDEWREEYERDADVASAIAGAFDDLYQRIIYGV